MIFIQHLCTALKAQKISFRQNIFLYDKLWALSKTGGRGNAAMSKVFDKISDDFKFVCFTSSHDTFFFYF